VIGGRPVASGGYAPLTTIANLTGLPAASLPIGLTEDGRPVGLQVMVGHLRDLDVLSLCAVVEGLLPPVSWSDPLLR
jgi:aspartyl-tRNA(Asn)/glutamyl-tRNA(Gln) amidotransferase subunit A